MSQVAVLELRQDQQQVVFDDRVLELEDLGRHVTEHALAGQGLRVIRPLARPPAHGRMPVATHFQLFDSAYAALRQLQAEAGARRYTVRLSAESSWLLRDCTTGAARFISLPASWHELFDTLDRTGSHGAELFELNAGPEVLDSLLTELEDFRSQWREAYTHSPNRRSTAATPIEAPLPDDAADSARRRAEFVAGWWTGAQVAAALGSRARSNPAQYGADLRRRGRLLGVWHAPDRAYYHPPCQIHAGQLIPQVAELLEILPGPSRSGWEQAEWLYSPHALLEARTPADVLPDDPDRVVAAAREEYQDGADAGW